MAKDIKSAEKKYMDNQDHMNSIQSGESKPDTLEKIKKSIYADFLDNVTGKPTNELIKAMENEIYRNINTFESETATKRIMELIWMTRGEW